jgi:hypothetical protein
MNTPAENLLKLIQDKLAYAKANDLRATTNYLEELLAEAGVIVPSETVTLSGTINYYGQEPLPYTVTFKPRKNAKYVVIAEYTDGAIEVASQSATYRAAEKAADRLEGYHSGAVKTWVSKIETQYTTNN